MTSHNENEKRSKPLLAAESPVQAWLVTGGRGVTVEKKGNDNEATDGANAVEVGGITHYLSKFQISPMATKFLPPTRTYSTKIF